MDRSIARAGVRLQACHGSSSLGVIGSFLTRLAVALNIAFAIAAAVPGTPISPVRAHRAR
jgi:hypothetical protein